MAWAVNFIRPKMSKAGFQKYAVAEGWIMETSGDKYFDQGPVGIDNVTHMCCPIVLSLRSAAAMAHKALPESEKKQTRIDRVLYTEKTSFGDKAVNFMEAHSIRVVDMSSDPIMAKVADSPGIEPKGTHNYANMKKLQFLWDTHYNAILLIDYDVFFPMKQPFDRIVDMLGTVAHGEKSMYTFRGERTPVAGGIVAVRPSQEFGSSFLHAMQHGFSMEDGWGGNYSTRATDASFKYYQKTCNSNQFPGDRRCCVPGLPTTFCFAAAYLDQGLLFHVAVDGQQDRRVHSDKSWVEVGAHQYNLWPKPWNTHKLDVLLENGRMKIVKDFWDNWTTSQSALLEDDSPCSTYFQKMHKLYNVCYEQSDPTSLTSQQVKDCIAQQSSDLEVH